MCFLVCTCLCSSVVSLRVWALRPLEKNPPTTTTQPLIPDTHVLGDIIHVRRPYIMRHKAAVWCPAPAEKKGFTVHPDTSNEFGFSKGRMLLLLHNCSASLDRLHLPNAVDNFDAQWNIVENVT